MLLNTGIHILNEVWWNIACAGDWGDACHCSSDCDTFLVGLTKLLRLHPSRYISQCRERNMLPFYALHSLLVLFSHCNTAVFQHTNNRDCGGSSPPRCAANHPGVTTCQGTLSLWPQLHSSPDFAVHGSLANTWPIETAVVRMYSAAVTYLTLLILWIMPFLAVEVAERLFGCAAEDRLNGPKGRGFTENIGVIYSHGSWTACFYASAQICKCSFRHLIVSLSFHINFTLSQLCWNYLLIFKSKTFSQQS